MSQLVQTLCHREKSANRTRLAQFLDAELRPEADFSVVDEFPSLFRDFPGGDSLYIERSGRIATHAGVLAREYFHPDFTLRVGLIGSVATAADWRGHGLGRQIVGAALERLSYRGCAIAVLWSDTPEFYAPMGFTRAGRERDIAFSPTSVLQPTTEALAMDPERHAPGIWRLYLRHEGRLDRSLEEQKRLVRIPRARFFVTEKQGAVTSYLAIQKGIDFAGYIHEWGGDLEALRQNIAWVQRNAYPEQGLTLIAPASLELRSLEAMAERTWNGVVGLVKLLDRRALMASYLAWLRKRGIEGRWNSIDGVMHLGEERIALKKDEDYLMLVLGSELTPTRPVLPFFLWGLDSI